MRYSPRTQYAALAVALTVAAGALVFAATSHATALCPPGYTAVKTTGPVDLADYDYLRPDGGIRTFPGMVDPAADLVRVTTSNADSKRFNVILMAGGNTASTQAESERGTFMYDVDGPFVSDGVTVDARDGVYGGRPSAASSIVIESVTSCFLPEPTPTPTPTPSETPSTPTPSPSTEPTLSPTSTATPTTPPSPTPDPSPDPSVPPSPEPTVTPTPTPTCPPTCTPSSSPVPSSTPSDGSTNDSNPPTSAGSPTATFSTTTPTSSPGSLTLSTGELPRTGTGLQWLIAVATVLVLAGGFILATRTKEAP